MLLLFLMVPLLLEYALPPVLFIWWYNSGGGITAASGSITGDFSVGGVLTYEDVTNVDSVGLITARQGIDVTGGGIFVTSGLAATSFGDE